VIENIELFLLALLLSSGAIHISITPTIPIEQEKEQEEK